MLVKELEDFEYVNLFMNFTSFKTFLYENVVFKHVLYEVEVNMLLFPVVFQMISCPIAIIRGFDEFR